MYNRKTWKKKQKGIRNHFKTGSIDIQWTPFVRLPDIKRNLM